MSRQTGAAEMTARRRFLAAIAGALALPAAYPGAAKAQVELRPI